VAPVNRVRVVGRLGADVQQKRVVAGVQAGCELVGADRDANAAWNILSRGLTDLGVGHSEGTSPEIGDFWCADESQGDSSTPVETALPTGTAVVPAKRVVGAGSPCLKEPPTAASRQG